MRPGDYAVCKTSIREPFSLVSTSLRYSRDPFAIPECLAALPSS